ncbi:MAG TPA: biotin-dependent carboxyltransferase family protein [Chthoniobacterales bacterium]
MASSQTAFTVVQAGFLTTVQDVGRPGLQRFGVSAGGALDGHALRVANLLLANEETAAGLEITLGGLRVSFAEPRLVSWCGGDFDVTVGGAPLAPGRVGLVQAGQDVFFNRATVGCRAWLALAGGIDAALVLKSRSTDLRAAFGGFYGRALRSGDIVPLLSGPPSFDRKQQQGLFSRSAPPEWARPAKASPVLRFIRGTDWHRFTPAAQQALVGAEFTVSPDSNRMGARLEGPPLARADRGDLISEAVAPGTIQVPPSGQPILLLGDCQTIGGYPKIGNVITVDLPLAAQLSPGQRLRFREVSMGEAHHLLLVREHQLSRFSVGISLQH